ncbi:helix-turn-helix transcriptional regulator [Ramlibacter sp. PS4R-6]|uniref:helix-turn-helix transcriptional regulator n=1 Tax=Ramlibacter sp. PS4R-6 TaxID=3133438 RepID=UPI00309EA6D3
MPRPALQDVRFHNPRLARIGVEVMTLAELRRRTGAALGAPERVDFLMLLLVQAGRGQHSVDFARVPLAAGTLLVVKPGQVHRWQPEPALQGRLVLVAGDALDAKLLALPDWPATARPSRALFRHALATAARLQADLDAFAGTDLEAAFIRHELMALLLRLARECRPVAPAPEGSIHRLFLRELEAHFHRRLSVLDYARRLGYSESTVSRACVAATGITAKEAIDRRVALEARRLLAHGDDSVVQVAHRLGFSEPTNFVKFFRRTCGCTPLAFRSRARG